MNSLSIDSFVFLKFKFIFKTFENFYLLNYEGKLTSDTVL